MTTKNRTRLKRKVLGKFNAKKNFLIMSYSIITVIKEVLCAIFLCVCVLRWFSRVWLLATLWTVAHQAPLSMGFSRLGYWSGLLCPPPGDLPDPEIKPISLMSPALAGGFFTTSPIREACVYYLQEPPWQPSLDPGQVKNPSSSAAWQLSSCAVQLAVLQGLCAKRENG